MKVGLAIFATDEGLQPAELGALVERAGFESLFVTEHTHIPVSRDTPAPRGGTLPRAYARTLDPFVALTAAAVSTTTLRLGTGVCLLAQRDPIITAKEISTLDWVSGGRVVCGVGAGWNLEELRNHGTEPERRFRVLHERLEAMRAIWSDDEASYQGETVSFDRIWSWPKPAQRPHPPILLAGNGPNAENRAVRARASWMPIPEEGLDERVETFLRRSDRPTSLKVTIYGADPGDLERYRALGVERCICWLPPAGEDEIRRRVGELAEELHGSDASAPAASSAPCSQPGSGES